MRYGTENIRFCGRWYIRKNANAVTTACGSVAEFGFYGHSAVLECNMDYMKPPYPHLWISVDGGARIETAVDRFLRIYAEEDGVHIVKIILKSSTEMQHRWFEPLEAKLEIIGIEAERMLELPHDTRKIIEFVGDSITEGILVDENNRILPADDFIDDQINRVYQDDVSATYGYLAAQELGCRAAFFAYGGVGITKGGSGGVPKAEDIYQYCFNGSENKAYIPDLIVINYGANDWNVEPELYISGYEKLLKAVRGVHKDTQIVLLSPFKGFFADDLYNFVGNYNKKYNDNIFYINSSGWIPKDPVHPIRENHKKIAEHLVPILKKFI